jgi:hypothetical protein
MQVHNAIKYATGDLNAFQLASGVARDATGVERFGETLTPVMDIYSTVGRRAEFDIHRNVFDWAQNATQAAIAAEQGFIGVGLPAPVGTSTLQILVVEGCTVMGAAGTYNMLHSTRAIVAATGTLIGTLLNRDQRWANAAFVNKQWPPVEGWTGTDPAFLGTFFEQVVVPAAVVAVPFSSGPWIVKPGGALLVQHSTVNVAVTVNMWGFVRPALPGEFPNPLS